MAGEVFKLNFISDGTGIKTISEPIGFDSIPFTLKQDDKRLARDVFFGGDNENKFEFYRMRDHEIDLLFYYHETYGWESEVKLIIEKDGIDNIIGDLDFANAETDLLEYFKCTIIQDGNQALLKRREDVDVDLFSNESIDGEEIAPVSTDNVLVKALPTNQESRWELPESYAGSVEASINITRGDRYYALNPCVNLVSSSVEDSYTILSPLSNQYKNESSIRDVISSEYSIVSALNNLRNVTVNIIDLDFFAETFNTGGGGSNGYTACVFELRHGADYHTAERVVFFDEAVNDGDSFSKIQNYSYNIDFLNRGDKIWLYFYLRCRISSTGGGSIISSIQVNSMNVDVTATSVSYNTIVPSVRLYDAVYQNVKSISGLDSKFKLAEQGGELYDNRLFNGNLLRGLKDKPFILSLKSISEWLPEIYGDYQTQDDSVFFGEFSEYYKNKEIGYFDDVRKDSYVKKFNERVSINEFYYSYKNYQSQKESEIENSFDIIHAESQWFIQNKKVENKKEVDIGFIRDSFLIDDQRKKAFDINETTSTQDDNSIFIIDTKKLEEDLVFNETDELEHIYIDSLSDLKIRNNGSFNFVLLGVSEGSSFRILGNDTNAGTYRVESVSEREIILSPVLNIIGSNGNGIRLTNFEYQVTKEHVPYVSWSNEGFSVINGIYDKDGFANLRFSPKRNINRFYSSYLSTCNIYTGKPIKNTSYINNGDLELTYNGQYSKENGDLNPSNPKISPFNHEVIVITDFNTFIDTVNKSRTEKGYITVKDSRDFLMKIYPQEMTFSNTSKYGELIIKGEQKYETGLINIIQEEGKPIYINNEYIVHKIKYKKKSNKFLIFDNTNKLLYNSVYWYNITLNGSKANDQEELETWLTLIS